MDTKHTKNVCSYLDDRLLTALENGRLPKDIHETLLELRSDVLDKFCMLEHAEHEWLVALDAIPQLIFLHDHEFRIIRANHSYAKRAGMDESQLKGQLYWQVFPKLDAPINLGINGLDSHKDKQKVLRLPTGETFIYRHYPIYDFSGNYEYSLNILEDTSDQLRLKQEHDSWNEALNQLAEAIQVLDEKGGIRYVNPAFYKLFKYTERDVIGKSISILGDPKQDNPQNPLYVLKQLREHGEWKGEVNRIAKDGTAISVLLRASILRDAEGHLTGYVGSYLDLRDIHNTENQLRESEQLFRAITMAAQDAVIMFNEQGRVVFWNNAATAIFGYLMNEVHERTYEFLLTDNSINKAFKTAWSHFIKGNAAPLTKNITEFESKHKNGKKLPIEVSVAPVEYKGSLHAVGVFRDISERKKAQHQQQLFRDLLDYSNDAIEITNPETLRFIDTNETACRVLGYSREELLSMSIFDIDPDLDEQDRINVGKQIEEKGSAIFKRRHRRKDDTTFPVEVSVKAVTIDKQTYGLNISRDITEREKADIALKSALRIQRALSACNSILVHAKAEKTLLQDMCNTIVEVAGYCHVWIALIGDNSDKSFQFAAYAGNHDLTNKKSIDQLCSRSILNQAIQTGKSQVINNILNNPSCFSCHEHARDYQYKSCITLPLIEDDQMILGGLTIHSADSNAFDSEEINLLEELARDLAFGLKTLRVRKERDHFQTEHLKGVDKLKESLINTIKAIGLTVEKRDPYTAGHQSRVADLAVAIAEELKLDTDIIEGLKFGAMIHDIGKIYIPSEILNRPGRLTHAEFEMIKSHPEVGYEIIKDIDFPWPVAKMILQHHERLDGTGYPNGLKGSEIIQEARILAVADVVEAITAHRPYRPAIGLKKALEEIEHNSGTRYDPEVVTTCLKLFREKHFKFPD